jgi:hypothetical protein
VGSVDIILPINPPRRDDPEGRVSLLHLVDLYSRGVSAEHVRLVGTIGVVQVETILHVTGGVIRGTVQGLEAVVVTEISETSAEGLLVIVVGGIRRGAKRAQRRLLLEFLVSMARSVATS